MEDQEILWGGTHTHSIYTYTHIYVCVSVHIQIHWYYPLFFLQHILAVVLLSFTVYFQFTLHKNVLNAKAEMLKFPLNVKDKKQLSNQFFYCIKKERDVSRNKLLELVDMRESRCHFEIFFFGSFLLRQLWEFTWFDLQQQIFQAMEK